MQKQDELGVRFGKYHVFAKLAVGGMAELFLAKQPGIGGFVKTVVLKCILPHLSQQDDFVTMFLDEARVVAPLDHPNIVQIYDIGERAGVYYIAMEYIRGQTLKEFRKKLFHQNPDVKPYKLSAGIIAQAAAGLYHAHMARDDDGTPLQLVHRDVSPTNLIVSYNGVIKLVDFGVAKASNQQHQTNAGTIKGKYRYMSPEQIRGHHLDHRSDVFSLGIVLYELSTNAALFGRRHEAEIIDAVRNARVPAPSKFRPDYPEALEYIVMKALAKDREDRYQTADEFRIALEKFTREEGSFYGTTQLAELMQYLFSKEQSEERTGITYKPLSPADFVRFLGEFPNPEALASYTGSFPKSTGEGSFSNSSAQPVDWSSNDSNEWAAGTPPHGPKSAVSQAPKDQTPASGSGMRSAPAASPFGHSEPSAQVPHDSSFELHEATRTEMAPAAGQGAESLDGVDFSPMEALEIDESDHTDPARKFNPAKRSSRAWLYILLLLLLGGGGAGAYFAFFHRVAPSFSFETHKQKVEALLQQRKYLDADRALGQIQTHPLNEKQEQWVRSIRQRIMIGPQFHMARQFFEQKKYASCLQILQQLKLQFPSDAKLQELYEKAENAQREAANQKLAVPDRIPPTTPRVDPIDPPTTPVRPPPRTRRFDRRRRRRRRGRRPPPPRKRQGTLVARTNLPPVSPSLRMGRLVINSRPRSRVSLDGILLGFTPINGKRVTAGTHVLVFRHSDYKTEKRTVEVDSGQTAEVDVTLRPLRVEPQPVPRRIVPQRTEPPPSGTQARYPFSRVQLPRRQELRIYISDPRNLAGRHSTMRLSQLSRQIESEVSRLLGSNFRVNGVTRSWQNTVRERATQRNQDYYTFYPRAVAYVIYDNLLKGRSLKRTAQFLVKYEYLQKFKRIRQ